MNNESLSRYVSDKLLAVDLRRYLKVASIVATSQDPELVLDVMVFIPDRMFECHFKLEFGDCFVIDDHDHKPPVFARFKSYGWLRSDFSKRLPIALWVFQNATIIQDPHGSFRRLLKAQEVPFLASVESILRRKYIEFRSERHNLRQAVWHNDGLAIDLLRSTVIKLALEMVLLSLGLPYPFKKWLPREVRKLGGRWSQFVTLQEEFLRETDPQEIITQSDIIVAEIAAILGRRREFPEGFLQQWWLHLS